jgi:hypothetical protein
MARRGHGREHGAMIPFARSGSRSLSIMPPVHRVVALLLGALAVAMSPAAAAPKRAAPEGYGTRADVRAFIDEMVVEHDYDRAAMHRG